MFEYVAEQTYKSGLSRGLPEHTLAWLQANAKDVDGALEFLSSVDVNSDWDLLVDADPYSLFGPTPDRFARMPLERSELRALIEYVDACVGTDGCDRSLRNTRAWLEQNHLPVPTTQFSLIALGGGCDCEVVLNVDEERIYPPDKN